MSDFLPPDDAMSKYFSKIPIPYEDENLYTTVENIISLFPKEQRSLLKLQYQDDLAHMLARYAVGYCLGSATPHILNRTLDAIEQGHLDMDHARLLADVLKEHRSESMETGFGDDDLQETDPQVPHLLVLEPEENG